MKKTDNNSPYFLDLLNSTELLGSSYDVSQDISVLFSTTNSITPSFNPTLRDCGSNESQVIDEENYGFNERQTRKTVKLQEQIVKPKCFNNFQVYSPLINRTVDNITDPEPPNVRAYSQQNRFNNWNVVLNENAKDFRGVCKLSTSNSNRERQIYSSTNIIDDHGPNKGPKNESIPNVKAESAIGKDICGGKGDHIGLHDAVSDRRVEFKNEYSEKNKCKIFNPILCKCCVEGPFETCLLGCLLILLGSGGFNGCWLYISLSFMDMCDRPVNVYYVLCVICSSAVLMIGFVIVILLCTANSTIKGSECFIIKTTNRRKHCSATILLFLIIQCFVWIFLFATGFYICSEIYLFGNISGPLCQIFEMNLKHYKDRLKGLSKDISLIVYFSILCTLVVVLGLMFTIIGVSMHMQQLKNSIKEDDQVVEPGPRVQI